jgi:hypothetical protein
MTQQQPLTADQIEAAVTRARVARAKAIRAGAVSLSRTFKRFLSQRRQAARALYPAKA